MNDDDGDEAVNDSQVEIAITILAIAQPSFSYATSIAGPIKQLVEER